METHDDSDAVAPQVELGQGVHAGEVVHVADVVAGQVQHAQLQQVVQVLDHADLEGRKVLFNDALDTFYIYGYMASGRKEMFYLTTHSTHFSYGYMERKGNVLFNDALNTFYLWLYGKERKCFI